MVIALILLFLTALFPLYRMVTGGGKKKASDSA